ncbi:hypothetical protein DICPUDRAFT_158048 [Dictyostelium purpureum]|uniref:MIT domain-containing protein n=1 Tax=Dictyostelium purpureum TaxID=5786 RepID=F1A0P5_DICPU|nr:uncharacterized protein DICPUDRAFT_158048 [Dictyostelium purpureum]EGC30225.1 hypothetical protein DICPUDRAFT_158048 [Dictyostelium purpureum]|eukprot:XP_003293239.1 hypothetical protein DICPUDRAFT_158048 [Dictyostelium purpureum]
MSELSSSQDISYILKAHSLVKKAQESEQLGLIEDAVEYHTQASNYFTLAIKQTNNQQTISALRVLSQNHFKKSNDLRNSKLNNLKNINTNNNINNFNDEDNDDTTPHLLIYNDNNSNINTLENNNINFNNNFNMYNNINMNNKNNINNNNNNNNTNYNIGFNNSYNENYNYNLSSSNPINISNNVNNNDLNLNNNNNNNSNNNNNNGSNNTNNNNVGSYSNSYNSMSDSTTDLSQISPNRLVNYINDSTLEDSIYDNGFSNSILQGGYYIYPENGKPRFHQESSSLPSNFGSSPHSTFWFGIEKLLDILPKPNVFGLNKYSNNHQVHQRNKSTDEKSLINSFFIVDPSKRLPNTNTSNNITNNYSNGNYNSNNNNNSNNNPNNNKLLNIINEDDENNNYRPSSSPNQKSNSYNNNNIKNNLNNSLDNDLASKLKQVEIDLVNHTVETLLEENKNLKQENEFLKDRIMQFRIEIEKKTNAIRQSKDSVSTQQRYNNRLSHSISPSHDINQSVSLPTKTSASFYQTNLSTLESNNSAFTNNSGLMNEIKLLKEQLEEKDKIIESQKKKWDKLIETAKKKREFNSSTNSNTHSSSSSPLSNSIHEQQ